MAYVLTTEDRIRKAVLAIIGHEQYRAYAGVMMVGTRTVSDETMAPGLPQRLTAYTDGENEVYGREFVDSLNDPELRFLVLHECTHKAYRHLDTWRWMFEADPECANMACDFVINAQLVEENRTSGFATMTGPLRSGCHDPKYLGWDAARVFHDIRKGAKNRRAGGSGSGSGSGSGGGFDQHGWEAAKGRSREAQAELARQIDSAIRQGSIMAGVSGTGGARGLGALLQPQVDWKEQLREFVSETCAGSDYSTWRRPNRRYVHAGIYMPSGISEAVGELVIAVDTSGTIDEKALVSFMSEVKGIADTVHPSGIRILYWDTEVCADEYYTGDDIARLTSSTKPAGGGGTMLECVPRHIARKGYRPAAVVVLTDGYLGGSWGNWAHPVMFCIIDNKTANPQTGRVVHIEGGNM